MCSKVNVRVREKKTGLDFRTIFIISIGGRVINGENQKSGTGEMLFINKKGLMKSQKKNHM